MYVLYWKWWFSNVILVYPTSWWFQPISNICSSNWIIFPTFRGENKTNELRPPEIHALALAVRNPYPQKYHDSCVFFHRVGGLMNPPTRVFFPHLVGSLGKKYRSPSPLPKVTTNDRVSKPMLWTPASSLAELKGIDDDPQPPNKKFTIEFQVPNMEVPNTLYIYIIYSYFLGVGFHLHKPYIQLIKVRIPPL